MTAHFCLQLFFLAAACLLAGQSTADKRRVHSRWDSSIHWDRADFMSNTITRYPLHVGSDFQKPVYSSHYGPVSSNTTLWSNVRCGGGYCPSDAPICCGDYPSFFCIPGGMKCCNSPGGISAACEQSAECCATRKNATCCERGTTCLKDGEEVLCEREACTKYESADECLHQWEGCAWCCAERRCISRGRRCTMDESPIQKGEVCPSPCEYADTCNLCLSSNKTGNASNSCLWCCTTQSCMSVQNSIGCKNDQAVLAMSVCPACQANGHGINPQFVGTFEQLFALFSVIVLIFGIIFSFAVGRAFISYRGTIVMQNGMRLADVEAQFAVRRHGFGASVPVPAQVRLRNTLKRFFGMMVSVFRPNSKGKGEDLEAECPIPRGNALLCSACQRVLRVRALSSVVKGMKGPSGLQGTPAEDTKLGDFSVGDDVVLLLPCSHLFCRPCIGLVANRESSEIRLREVLVEAQPPQNVDAACEDRIHYNMFLDASATDSRDGKTSVGRGSAFSRETEEVGRADYIDGPRVAREVMDNSERGFTAGTTAVTPPSRIGNWTDAFLCSLQQQRSDRESPVSREDRNVAKAFLKKIKQKCPTCRQRVVDTLFLEDVIHL